MNHANPVWRQKFKEHFACSSAVPRIWLFYFSIFYLFIVKDTTNKLQINFLIFLLINRIPQQGGLRVAADEHKEATSLGGLH